MKKFLIITGPNGAGKTTLATEILPNEAGRLEFVNADLIAAGLSPFQPDQVAFAASRLMLTHIVELVSAGNAFGFETTPFTRAWLRLVQRWKSVGYRVKFYVLTLPDPNFAICRVERRVHHSGHAISPETVRRCFAHGLEHLRQGYLGIVDERFIYDGSENPPRLLETGDESADYLVAWQNVSFTEGAPFAVARKAFGSDPKAIIEDLNLALFA